MNKNKKVLLFVIIFRAFSYLTHVIPDFTDNCLINIVKYGENYYASSEVNYIRRIDPRTLETLEKVKHLACELHDISLQLLNLNFASQRLK